VLISGQAAVNLVEIERLRLLGSVPVVLLRAVPSVLGWGLPGVLQARAAARVARLAWELPVNAPAPAGYED
jgi:hypothetical protein